MFFKQPQLRRIDVLFYVFVVVFAIVAGVVWRLWDYNRTVYVDLGAISILTFVGILRTFECSWQRWLNARLRWVRKPLPMRHVDLLVVALTFVHMVVLCTILIKRVVSTYLPVEMIAWGVLYGLAYGTMVTHTRAGRWLREEAYLWKLEPMPVATIPLKEYRVQD